MGKRKRNATQAVDEAVSQEEEAVTTVETASDEEGEFDDPVAELTQERDELLDQLLRTQAEFDNYRKRIVRERREARLTAQEEVLKEILPILDSCEMGLDSFREATSNEARLPAYQEGYELFLKSLQALLSRFGIIPVPGPGEPFDPAYHEAVLREESNEFEEGQVIDEFRRGYLFQGRLLRPSQVRVAVKPEKTVPS